MERIDLSWTENLKVALHDFKDKIDVRSNKILVVGCSTSEIVGERIGSSGSSKVAELIFNELQQFSRETGIMLAFQCCEHLNRAIVIDREIGEKLGLDEVAVVPELNAGGAMASYAYRNIKDAYMVEHIKADFGIDIGDTLIGMHLKHVAVPVRVSVKEIGHAHLTMAKTRPKLIGGERANYCMNK